MQINKRSTAEEYREAFLNVISEYVLVSIGILTPELFRLNRSHVESDEYENARDNLRDDGIDLDRLMDHWGLTRQGTFFWNRWSVRGMRPSYATDEMVREFMTDIIRQSGDEILAAVGYGSWFARVKGIVVNAGMNPESRQRAQEELREILIATVDNDRVHQTLVRLMQGPWFEKLQAFMQPR